MGFSMATISKLADARKIVILPEVPQAAQAGHGGSHIQVQLSNGYTSFSAGLDGLSYTQQGIIKDAIKAAKAAGKTAPSLSGSMSAYVVLDVHLQTQHDVGMVIFTLAGVEVARGIVDASIGPLPVIKKHTPVTQIEDPEGDESEDEDGDEDPEDDE